MGNFPINSRTLQSYFREEEREMKPYCDLMGVSMTPYSSLASGRLSRHPGETSKRLKEDVYAKGKYDEREKEDLVIIQRVEELAKKEIVQCQKFL